MNMSRRQLRNLKDDMRITKDAINAKYLDVSECFYSIQGEGQTMGIPAIFVRLKRCNILCKSESWVCDTIEVWRKGTKILFADVLTEEMVDKLRRGAHLVFTGGEPLLHENAIDNFIYWFRQEKGFLPIIEVETNGTILPTKINHAVRYWNVSPKLTNSGVKKEHRYNGIALGAFTQMSTVDNLLCKVIFKFVISNESDYEEILQDFGDLNFNAIVLMPAGASQDELAITRPIVAELCKKTGLRYSDRLHVVIWNLKTGV